MVYRGSFAVYGKLSMIDDPTPAPLALTEKDIKDAITSLMGGFDDELYALSEAELVAKWYFSWDERADLAWNLYQFSGMLEMHRRTCRRWEEHHHGHDSVVERVRDKYLLPRITAFLDELKVRMA